MNVLAVGTDSREGLSPQELAAIGTEEVSGERADTIILVHILPERPVVMVSFPRDLKVQVPGRGVSKLNAALAYGGPDLLVETIEDYAGIQIDRYVQVNIAGFLRLVDVAGGVRVCLDEPLVDPYAGAHLPAGCQNLRGPDAAAYVRSRHADPNGDLGRIARQQRFLRAAMEKVVSAGTFSNPVRMKRVIDAAAAALVTDPGFGTPEMARIAWSLRWLDPESIDMRTVPGNERMQNGVFYYVADPEAAEWIFQSLREGAPLPERDTSAGSASRTAAAGALGHAAAGAVRVAILNAAGVAGAGAKAKAQLQAADFEVVRVGDLDRFGRRRTILRYAPGAQAKAELVARQFSGAKLEVASDTGDVDVVVLLGTDWARRRAG